jgi:hypothetical protein
MEYIIITKHAPAGYFSHLAVVGDGLNDVTVAKTYTDSVTEKRINKTGLLILTCGPKGKWSATSDEAVAVVRAAALKEAKKLAADGDLRPSQARRLELLNGWLAGAQFEEWIHN